LFQSRNVAVIVYVGTYIVRAPFIVVRGVIAAVSAVASRACPVSQTILAINAANVDISRAVRSEFVEGVAGGHGGPDELKI
jgi:hypothetical protein